MSKIPKFMVATNPLVDADKQYILHTGSPEVLIRAIKWDDVDASLNADVRLRFPAGELNRVKETRYVLYFEKFFEQSEKENTKKLTGLMKRAQDWWFAYLRGQNL